MAQAITLPKLTDHEPLADALAAAERINAEIAPVAAELREVEADIARLQMERADARRTAREQAIAGVIAAATGGQQIDIWWQDIQALSERRTELATKIDILAEAGRRFHETTVLPALAGAIARFGPIAVEKVWKPVMKAYGLAVAELNRRYKDVVRLREALHEAGLDGITTPHTYTPHVTLGDPADALVRELIRDGYLAGSDVK